MFEYRGIRNEEPMGTQVTVRTQITVRRLAGNIVSTWHQLHINTSLRVRRHSPTGFEWGYGGSGPAQLSLALLLHHLSDGSSRPHQAEQDVACDLHQLFKGHVVGRLPREGWTLTTAEIDLALEKIKESRQDQGRRPVTTRSTSKIV